LETRRAATGLIIAQLDYNATQKDIKYIDQLIEELRQNQNVFEELIWKFMSAARLLADLLADRLFLTLRAREIFLGLDPVELAPYDMARILPDREGLLQRSKNGISQIVSECSLSLTSKAAKVITWSNVYEEMVGVSGFSFTPVTVNFYTQEPEALASLRTAVDEDSALTFEIGFDHLDANTYEARFESATVTLDGAKFTQGTMGKSVRLWHTGIYSLHGVPAASVQKFTLRTMFLGFLE
jgi:hypothetical protein